MRAHDPEGVAAARTLIAIAGLPPRLVQLFRPGADVVIDPGHPDDSPRFGFRPAVEFGLRGVYDVPDEAFMAMGLKEGHFGRWAAW